MRLYREHRADGMLPTSNRFLVYELIYQEIIAKKPSGILKPGAKMQRRTDQEVIDQLTVLRERGEISWDAIVDETRSLDGFIGFKSVAEGLAGYLEVIRLDPWNGDPPLTLTESRSLAGVLRGLIRNYAAMIAATNGQAAGFLHNVVAPALHDDQRVLYLGDYDLAGGDIEANTRRVLERKTGFNLKWERLALTADQVREHGLTPIIKTDGRFKNGGAHEAVETEALSQRLIVQIVRDRLDELLPEPLSRFLVREEIERERLRVLLGRA